MSKSGYYCQPMTKTQYIQRSDSTRVTNIISEAFSRTMPCEETEDFTPISPEKIEKMGFPLAELQEVEWECEKGVYGPFTLLKETETERDFCPECDGEGWKDQCGDTICRDCGLVLNSTPELVPEDSYGGNRGGNTDVGAHNVFFDDGTGGAVAMNTNGKKSGHEENGPSEQPGVQ